MKRALTVALIAGGLAAGLAPVAQAAPWCGPYAGVRCTPDNRRFCQVYVAPNICVEL